MATSLRFRSCHGLCALTALLAAFEAAAEESVAERLLSLSPERLAACREALAEFLAPSPTEFMGDSQLFLESRHSGRAEHLGLEGTDDPVSVGGNLLLPEEAFFIQGREDDYRDAAENWLLRSLKGSSATGSVRPARLSVQAGWNDGPTCTVGARGFSLRVGDSGEWRLRWSRKSRLLGGPWKSSAWIGESDDELRVGFSFGRSLLAARTAR